MKKWLYNLFNIAHIEYAGKNAYYVSKRMGSYDPRNNTWWYDHDNKKDYCRLDIDTAKEVLEDVKKVGKIPVDN